MRYFQTEIKPHFVMLNKIITVLERKFNGKKTMYILIKKKTKILENVEEH